MRAFSVRPKTFSFSFQIFISRQVENKARGCILLRERRDRP